MRIRVISIGMTVYHSLYPHWGKGTVAEIRHKDNLGLPTARKVLVVWADRPGTLWMHPSDLRKTPKGTRKGTGIR